MINRFHSFYVAVILAALALALALWRVSGVPYPPGPLPSPGLAAAIVLLLSLLSFGLWRWTGAMFWRVLSPGLLFAGTMIVAAGAYQQWVVMPIQAEGDLEGQGLMHNQRILASAIDERSCPGGHRIVVTPGDPQRSGEGDGLNLEVFLVPVDETERALRLAAGRPNHGLMSYPALEEFRGLLESCFQDGETLDGFLEAVARRAD
jgi:hypothetical protein